MTTSSMYEDGTYLQYNPTWHRADSAWKAGHICNMLKKNGITPATICEIGCGAGEILTCLADELGEKAIFHGYDISPQAMDICKKKERSNVHFFHENLLEKEGPFFDVLMAVDVFEHVDDYLGFLRKLRTKGKHKIFHIPLDLTVQGVLRGSPILKARSTAGHLHYFTKETALATLTYTGYEVIDHFYTRGSLDLPDRGWRAGLLNLPRRFMFSINQDMTVRMLGGFSLLVLAR